MANEKNYEIIRWDIVQDHCSNRLKPAIYFTPDMKAKEFADLNSNKVRVKISDDVNPYGGAVYWATIDKSMNIPNCRPNFFDATGFYIAELDTDFSLFPETMGNFSFMEDVIIPQRLEDVIPEKFEENQKIQYRSGNKDVKKNDKNCNTPELLLIIAGIVIFLLLCFLFCKNKKK